MDVSKSVLVFVTATGRVCMAIPGWIRDFYSMPKEDWAAWKAGAWKTVKHEAHHYWVGTKLLGMDIKIASRLAIKAARGVELSRYVCMSARRPKRMLPYLAKCHGLHTS